MNNNKPWLKYYPKGVSPTINFDEYSSLVDMFDKTCERFALNNTCVAFLVPIRTPRALQKSTTASHRPD